MELLFALMIIMGIAVSGTKDDPYPPCQCDPAETGFCDLTVAPYSAFDCSTTAGNRACAKNISDALWNDTIPSCNCLLSCSVMPPPSASRKCMSDGYHVCMDEAGCSDDDDNNDMCLYFCSEFFVRNNTKVCGAWHGKDWTPCEAKCLPFMTDWSDADAPSFAECIYECRSGSGLA